MTGEFKRLGPERFGTLTAVLEMSGALGLVVGVLIQPVLLISSGGLAILMFPGLLAGSRAEDGFRESLPRCYSCP